MGRFRALLIGIAEYDDPSVRPLPFVTDGLSAIGAALESRGYVLDEGSTGSGRLNRTELLTQVQDFLQSADSDDTLLLFLSGHGAHSDDVDYLVPSDAKLSWLRLADVCVPLNAWAPLLENTAAARVIFLVDACREGFDENVMGPAGRAGWSRSKGLAVANRHVAFVFACPPGAVARYVQGEENFSLFGRAIQQITADPDGPSVLSEFRSAVERAMKDIADANGKPVQDIRVRTECDQESFIVLPPGKQSVDRENWRRIAAEHTAWECAAHEDGCAAALALTDRLVAQLAVTHRAASRATEDPWRDPSIAQRVSEQVGFLLGKVLGRPMLSPAEAALLVTTPFLYASYWSAEGARLSFVSPTDLQARPDMTGDRGSFERFARGYPRLLRRATANAGAEAAVRPIGWWIFHRWLTRRPESYFAGQLQQFLEPLTSDDRLATDLWAANRMAELLRCFGADPGFLARTDRPAGLANRRMVATGTAHEQPVRERLVGYLLAAAHYLAIEPICLPDIIADHLAIGDPVSPADVLKTVTEARWEPRGHSRALNTSCGHPAIEVALRQHVRDLDVLLGNAHRLALSEIDLSALHKMPVHATADLVRPAEPEDNPVYTSAGVRFRLDEDRVQELLMGEQLYGDRGLAIRELYQNALDACRYRQARTEYLKRAKGLPSDWHGLISFEQGVDQDGRPYIDCSDNGIGMGMRELSEVFAQAGTRFADLPEFLEEQAEWAQLTPPVRLYPNSRFGIGVLSYFMLADEITITTCRLGRDGKPTRRLQVSIAGPGNLFRINDLGADGDAGTTVRLHLRPDQDPVSCAGALSDVLWVAQFETRVLDASGVTSWAPAELAANVSPAVDYTVYDISASYAAQSSLLNKKSGSGVACSAAPVWWRPGNGQILADGVATDKHIFGAVVNLEGQFSPALSVDRRTIIGNRPLAIEVLLQHAAPELLSKAPTIASYRWLARLAEDAPGIADLIAHSAIEEGKIWEINDDTYRAAAIGCWPWDFFILNRSDSRSRPQSSRSVFQSSDYNMADWISAWRATALGCWPHNESTGKPHEGVIPALPSDMLLTSIQLSRNGSWLDPSRPVPTGHLVRVAVKLSRNIRMVAERLAVLGYQLPDVSRFPDDLGSADAVMIDRNIANVRARRTSTMTERQRESWLAEVPNWLGGYDDLDFPNFLSEDEAVPLGHVIAAAVRLRRSAKQVAERLAVLGYRTPECSHISNDLTTDDVTLVKAYFRHPGVQERPSGPEYLDPSCPVPLGHVIRAALQIRRSGKHVLTRLAAFGFSVPSASAIPYDITQRDVALLTYQANSESTWLNRELPVPLNHMVLRAARLGTNVGEVAGRLASFGFTVPDTSLVTSDNLSDDDAALISDVSRGKLVLLDYEVPVPLAYVLRAALKLHWTPGQAASRLTMLGYTTSELSHYPALRDDDSTMISWQLDGASPWLDPARIVPLAHVLSTAVKLQQTATYIAERFSMFGYRVCDVSGVSGDVSEDDLHLLESVNELPARLGVYRVNSGGHLYFDESADLPPAPMVMLHRVIRAAVRLGRGPHEIAQRLAELGFSVPDMANMPDDLTEDDVTLIETGRYDRQSLDATMPVPLGHIIRAAAELHRDVGQVADRLAALGYTVPDSSVIHPGDKALIRTDFEHPMRYDTDYGWLDRRKSVPLSHMLRASLALGYSLGDVADRLRILGFDVPDIDALLPRSRPGD